MGDVLEHIEEEQGIELIKKLYTKCDELVVAIPFNAPQGVILSTDIFYYINLFLKLKKYFFKNFSFLKTFLF